MLENLTDGSSLDHLLSGFLLLAMRFFLSELGRMSEVLVELLLLMLNLEEFIIVKFIDFLLEELDFGLRLKSLGLVLVDLSHRDSTDESEISNFIHFSEIIIIN